jgi:hypothetical protein
MRASIERIQGDRCLCKVRFEAEPENPDTHNIEVIYEVHRPAEDDFAIEADPHFMERLSCTRTDTREAVILPTKTEQEVKRTVMQKIVDTKVWDT